MLVSPAPILRAVGWTTEVSPFFAAQSGLFLSILGGTYLAGIRRRCFLAVLVASKSLAPVFLVWMVLRDAGPRVLYAQAIADGAMGAVVAWLWWRESRTGRASPVRSGRGRSPRRGPTPRDQSPGIERADA